MMRTILLSSCLALRPVNDTMDDIFEDSGDEEESQDIVNQVLDEIGIEISGKVRPALCQAWSCLPRTAALFPLLQRRHVSRRHFESFYCRVNVLQLPHGGALLSALPAALPLALPTTACLCSACSTARMPCVWLPLRADMSYYPSQLARATPQIVQ